MRVFELIRSLFPLIPLLMLNLVFFASFWFHSTKLPGMEADSSTSPPESSVDKHCRDQLIHYLLDHAVELVTIFGWLWIRFSIAYGIVRLVMDEILRPIVVFLARKAYGYQLFAAIGFQLTTSTPNEEAPVVITTDPVS